LLIANHCFDLNTENDDDDVQCSMLHYAQDHLSVINNDIATTAADQALTRTLAEW
jgi:hypothetical protein